MSESIGFIKLPPDGAGKRAPHTVVCEIEYNNGTLAFTEGDSVTFSSSVSVGTVSKATGTTSNGKLFVKLETPVLANPAFIVGENILVNGSPIAQVAVNSANYYIQHNTVAGSDGTSLAEVEDGSLQVVFPEGSSTFDSAGRQRVSQSKSLGQYIFQYDLDPERFGIFLAGGGTVERETSTNTVLLTTTSANGDDAEFSTHIYHKYNVGTSQYVTMGIALSDNGKANCHRYWGLGDNGSAPGEGVFFHSVGTTLEVHLHSLINPLYRVPQNQWNIDRLDGSKGDFNKSEITLDLTKFNIFWIDFNISGAGFIRWGILNRNKRITCHELNLSGFQSTPVFKKRSLPIKIRQWNIGVVGSTSELRLHSATVFSEATSESDKRVFGTSLPTKTLWTSGSLVPYSSFRPQLTFSTEENRISSYGKLGTFLSTGKPVVVHLIRNPDSITGATWGVFPTVSSSIEGDITGTAIVGGRSIYSAMIGAGVVTELKFSDAFDDTTGGMRLQADGTRDMFVIAIQGFTSGSTDVTAAFNWEEVH